MLSRWPILAVAGPQLPSANRTELVALRATVEHPTPHTLPRGGVTQLDRAQPHPPVERVRLSHDRFPPGVGVGARTPHSRHHARLARLLYHDPRHSRLQQAELVQSEHDSVGCSTPLGAPESC